MIGDTRQPFSFCETCATPETDKNACKCEAGDRWAPNEYAKIALESIKAAQNLKKNEFKGGLS